MASTNETIPGTHGCSAGARTGGDLGAKVQSAAKGIKGIGEAIRGSAIAAIDSASGDQEGVQKNKQIANKGTADIDQGRAPGGSGAGYLVSESGPGNEGW